MSSTVNERLEGQAGEETAKTRAQTREFIVEYSSDTDVSNIATYNSSVVLALSGSTIIPDVGEPFPGDGRSYCTKRRAILYKDKYHWLVTCWHETVSIEEDPTTEDPVISFDSAQYTRVIEKAYQTGDARGAPTKAILNSADDPFDPPIQQPESRTLISVTQNVRNFREEWISEFENTINDRETRIAGFNVGVGQARMVRINAVPKTLVREELWDLDYWEVSFQVELDPDGYSPLKILDQGFNYIPEGDSAGTKTKFTVLDDAGEETFANEPQLLNGIGGKGSADDPKYVEYYTYWEADWRVLNLPRTV